MLIFIYSLVNVRSGFNLKGNFYFHTREGKNPGGHLGSKTTRAGAVTFRYPGGFVMIPDIRQTKPSGWILSPAQLLLFSEGVALTQPS